MSAIDFLRFPEIVLRDGELVGEFDYDPLEPISGDMQSSIKPTRIEATGDLARPFVFREDVELECEIKPYFPPDEEDRLDPDRTEWAFTARGPSEVVKDHALVMVMHPYSEDWMDWAPFLKGLQKNPVIRERTYGNLAKGEEHWKVEARHARNDPMETSSRFRRATLRAPLRVCPRYETGQVNFARQRKRKEDHEEKRPRRYWGLCPLGWGKLEGAAEEIRQTPYIERFLDFTRRSLIDPRYERRAHKEGSRFEHSLDDATLEATEALMNAAILKALAGPRHVNDESKGRPWLGRPVQLLATCIFLDSVARFMRRLKTGKGPESAATAPSASTKSSTKAPPATSSFTDSDELQVLVSENFDLDKAVDQWELLTVDHEPSINVGLAIAEVITQEPHFSKLKKGPKGSWKSALEIVTTQEWVANIDWARRLLLRFG